jgi:small subunit ribosomal protein S7
MAESDSADGEAPADEADDAPAAQLFGRWDITGIEYEDPSTERYLSVTPVAHTMGRHAGKQFQKSEISVVERLINRLMQGEGNTGKKQRAVTAVREAFDMIHDRTGENPIQILVWAVENSAPREETVRLKYGGISVPKAVDVAPQRRVDQALKFIAEGTQNAAFKSPIPFAEAVANQLMGAADADVSTYAVNQKDEKERVAAAAR